MAIPLMFKLFVRAQSTIYKLSGGKLASTMRGMPIILLTTRGRKTGAKREVPVVPYVEGDSVYVIASMGGAPTHPAWYTNLVANPEVEVQRGADRYRARAIVLEEPDRTQVWQRVTAAMPGFADYQRKTSRVIPVVRLART